MIGPQNHGPIGIAGLATDDFSNIRISDYQVFNRGNKVFYYQKNGHFSAALSAMHFSQKRWIPFSWSNRTHTKTFVISNKNHLTWPVPSCERPVTVYFTKFRTRRTLQRIATMPGQIWWYQPARLLSTQQNCSMSTRIWRIASKIHATEKDFNEIIGPRRQ